MEPVVMESQEVEICEEFCQCCLSISNLQDMSVPDELNSDNYFDMLETAFSIQIWQRRTTAYVECYGNINLFICVGCIERLRAACEFCNQVKKTQELIQNVSQQSIEDANAIKSIEESIHTNMNMESDHQDSFGEVCFVKSLSGHPMIRINGFTYYSKRNNKNGTVYWVCGKRAAATVGTCCASVTTLGTALKAVNGNHTCNNRHMKITTNTNNNDEYVQDESSVCSDKKFSDYSVVPDFAPSTHINMTECKFTPHVAEVDIKPIEFNGLEINCVKNEPHNNLQSIRQPFYKYNKKSSCIWPDFKFYYVRSKQSIVVKGRKYHFGNIQHNGAKCWRCPHSVNSQKCPAYVITNGPKIIGFLGKHTCESNRITTQFRGIKLLKSHFKRRSLLIVNEHIYNAVKVSKSNTIIWKCSKGFYKRSCFASVKTRGNKIIWSYRKHICINHSKVRCLAKIKDSNYAGDKNSSEVTVSTSLLNEDKVRYSLEHIKRSKIMLDNYEYHLRRVNQNGTKYWVCDRDRPKYRCSASVRTDGECVIGINGNHKCRLTLTDKIIPSEEQNAVKSLLNVASLEKADDNIINECEDGVHVKYNVQFYETVMEKPIITMGAHKYYRKGTNKSGTDRWHCVNQKCDSSVGTQGDHIVEINDIHTCTADNSEKNEIEDEKKPIIQKDLQFDLKNDANNPTCGLCNQQFMNLEDLQIHTRDHHPLYPPTQETPNEHINIVDILKESKCPICFEADSSSAHMQKHIKIAYKGKKPVYKCKQCDRTFGHFIPRYKHMVQEHDYQTYKCGQCEREFFNCGNLHRHVRRVHGEKGNFECDKCTFFCFSSQKLANHQIRHTSDNVFRCQQCLKHFARRKTLVEHMKVHNPVKDFMCNVCGVGFTRNDRFNNHMRLHERQNDVIMYNTFS